MARNDYFWVQQEDVIREKGIPVRLILRNQELHHAANVLRHRPGDMIWATDGSGNLYYGKIREITGDQATIQIDHQEVDAGEPKLRLTLAACLPKLQRFEFLLEKGTEIGVSTFWPIMSQYSVVKPGKGRLTRWQHIVKAALKQCGRSRLPEILPPQPIANLFQQQGNFQYRWIGHKPGPNAAAGWSWQQKNNFTIGQQDRVNALLLIGPEGGFSQEEIRSAHQAGFAFLDLGLRRLRAETAAIVASALLLHQFGDI